MMSNIVKIIKIIINSSVEMCNLKFFFIQIKFYFFYLDNKKYVIIIVNIMIKKEVLMIIFIVVLFLNIILKIIRLIDNEIVKKVIVNINFIINKQIKFMINNVLEIIVDVFNIFELICIYFFYLNNLYNYNNI